MFEDPGVRDGADNSPWHGREMKMFRTSRLSLSHWSLVQAGVGVPTFLSAGV